MALISFGKFNIFTSYLIISSLLKIPKKYIFQGLSAPNSLYYSFLDGIGNMLCLSFHPLTRRQKSGKVSHAILIESSFRNRQKMPIIKLIFFGFIVVLIFTIGGIFENLYMSEKIYNQKMTVYLLAKLCEIGMNLILSKFLLKYGIYKHNIISFIFIIVLSFLIMSLMEGFTAAKVKLLYSLSYFLYSFMEIIERWLLCHKNIEPYIYFFFIGLFKVIFVIIEGIIANFTYEELFSWKEFKNFYYESGYKFYTRTLIHTLWTFIYHNLYYLVIRNVGPIDWSFGDYFNLIIFHIQHSIENSFDTRNIIILFAYVIIIFWVLVNYQCLILHVCGLDTNTYKSIIDRANTERNVNFLELCQVDNEDHKGKKPNVEGYEVDSLY